MEQTKKLFRVTLKGMTINSTGISYGISYVIAENSNEAYKKVRNFLDKEDLGFSHERELDTVELLAEDYYCTDVRTLLFL
jgi:hypothetical protein